MANQKGNSMSEKKNISEESKKILEEAKEMTEKEIEEEKRRKRKADVNTAYYYLKGLEGMEMPQGIAIALYEKYSSKPIYVKKVVSVTKSAVIFITTDGFDGFRKFSRIEGAERKEI